MQDLDSLTDDIPSGVTLAIVGASMAINDNGWIVGVDSQYHAFLLAPPVAPAPGALLLLGSSLAGLAAFRRRRR